MTRTGHWHTSLARSARPWTVLLSCLLLAAQWVLLTHDHAAHADEHAPSQQAAHACDLCVAFAAAAPAPATAAVLALPRAAAPRPQVVAVPAFTRLPTGAHRSRAPPAFHSA